MKRLEKFLTENPGYLKWGVSRIATKLKLKESTVISFRKKDAYKILKANYNASK